MSEIINKCGGETCKKNSKEVNRYPALYEKVIKIMWVKTQIAKCKKVYLQKCITKVILSFPFTSFFFSFLFSSSSRKKIFHVIRLDLCFTSSFKTNIMKCILYSHNNDAVRQIFPVHTFVLICF